MNNFKLPTEWHYSNLEQLGDWGSGGTPKKSNPAYYKDGTIPWLVIGDLNDSKVVMSKNKITELGLKESSAKLLKKNTLLVGMYGSIGKLGVTGIECATNQAIASFVPYESVCNLGYLFYLLMSRREHLLSLGKGGAQQNISQTVLKGYDVPLAPLAEQKVIAEKLDTLLAQVEVTKARLENTLETLKQFRQSVLAAAVTGKLTEDWRAENPSLDPIELSEVGTYWAEQYKNSGKRLPKLKLHETDALDGLPDTWLDTKVGHVFDVYVGATPSRSNNDYWDGGINWVSSSEVAFCRISSTKETITESGLNNTSTNLHPPGTVMLAMIGQGKTRGQVAILDIEACHNQNTAALRVPKGFAVSEFLYFFLTKQYEETRRVGGGNNQKALNKSFVQSLPFPLPPLEEQQEIVNRVEKLFTSADATELKVNQALERVNSLTQSILAKALRGELTKQWRRENPELISGENSAEALLKKIKAERAAAKPKRKTRKVNA